MTRVNGPLGRALALVVCLVAATVFLANARRSERPVERLMFKHFPMTIDSWRAVEDPPIEEDVLKVLGVDDYLSRAYYKPDGAAVGLYIGFYGSQRQGDTIHSPLNCLPGAGWAPVSTGRLRIADARGPGQDMEVNRYVVQKGLDSQLVLYWYQSHGRVVASEYASRLYLIKDAIRLNRTDGSMVRVIAPVRVNAEDGGASAERLAAEFVRALVAHLSPYLPS
jgi:EpsI family protein